MNKRPFVIKPLNKLDDHLLIHKPEIWSARAHLVVWYCLLFGLGLSLLCLATGSDARADTNVVIWVGFIIVIAILALVVWIIYLVRFNVFKRYGIITPAGRLITFLLYLLASSAIAALCFIPPAVETITARRLYTNAELANDINSINTKICQLEYNILPVIWETDSVHVVDSIPGVRNRVDYEDIMMDDVYEPDTLKVMRYRLITKNDLEAKVYNKDSIEKVNDSIYVLFIAPDFEFLSSYNVKYYTGSLSLTSKMIYDQTLKNFIPPDRNKTKKELDKLLAKYYLEENEDRRYYYQGERETYLTKVKQKYDLPTIDEGISNIGEKINRFSGSSGIDFLRVWFYCSFCISLLLFIFRHSTIKTFFLSLLALVLIVIITSLIISFTYHASTSSFLWYFFYFLLFTVLGVVSFQSKQRNIVYGIAINLWMLLLPFIPSLATSYYYEQKREQDVIKNMIAMDYDKMHLHLTIAEIAGPLIFLILLATYIHKLYKNWYALPEE